jgi:hypothetical protein
MSPEIFLLSLYFPAVHVKEYVFQALHFFCNWFRVSIFQIFFISFIFMQSNILLYTALPTQLFITLVLFSVNAGCLIWNSFCSEYKEYPIPGGVVIWYGAPWVKYVIFNLFGFFFCVDCETSQNESTKCFFSARFEGW